MIDGLAQDVFEAELAGARLPNVQRLIAEGAYIRNGIGAFPSMTGFGFYPFLTGVAAVESGILGYRWFDRHVTAGNLRNYVGGTRNLMNVDIQERPPTLFEHFADQHTSSFNSVLDRGAHLREETSWSFAAAKFHDVSRMLRVVSRVPIVGSRTAPTMREMEDRNWDNVLRDLERRPKIQWIVLASPDAQSHMVGGGPGYVALLRHIDALIGRYRERAAQLGLEERRTYALVSDHGVVDVRRHIDLRSILDPHGVRLKRDPSSRFTGSLDAPLSELAGFDGIIAVNGNTMNYVYLKKPGGPAGSWEDRPTPAEIRQYPSATSQAVDLLAVLSRAPGIELVVARAESVSVVVMGSSGAGVIRERDGDLSYVVTGRDPLGYTAPSLQHLVDGQPHARDEWLAGTATSEYPYAVPRLFDLARHPDAGDLIVTAQRGYDLAPDFELVIGGYRGGHGGIRADQLRVPYVLSGAGVQPGATLAVARAEDVGVTLHVLLGIPVSDRVSGRLLETLLAGPAIR